MTKDKIIDYQNDGWLGIVPGVTLLQEMIDNFGQSDENWRTANSTGYSFASKTIEVTILDSTKRPIISIMRILKGCPHKNAIPETLEEANKIFGSLRQTEISESSIITFERPGLRIACDLFGDPPKIKWIEFYHQE